MLGVSPGALRKALERRAIRAPDGGTEANVDGVRGRVFYESLAGFLRQGLVGVVRSATDRDERATLAGPSK
jgi:hypothetical protein